MLIGLNFKNTKILLEVKNCNFFERFKGLMFTRIKKAKPLLFDFRKETKIPLHSFFVFFNFLVFWLDKNNNVIDYKICRPFQVNISTKRKFRKIVEIPLNKDYRGILKVLSNTYDEHEKV